MYYSIRNHPFELGFTLLLVLLLSACGTAQHAAKLESGYSPPAYVTVQVGEIKNSTGRVYDVDLNAMLNDALTEALQNQKMLATSPGESVLILNAEILSYEKGNAFGRWLWPGVGSTLLEVHCELRDGDKVVGVADAKRTVDAGGGYTIGAWKGIYEDVAKDIVEDLSAQLRKN